MLVNKKIMWQKYENVIEDQINSPLLNVIAGSMSNNNDNEINQLLELDSDEEEYHDDVSVSQKLLVTVPEDLSNEISLSANFDCWVGHANFNITESISNSLNKVKGVEVLKVCSRYRFFIGVGRMFDFADVRRGIEDEILNES
jgi:hypothetical protein